MKAKEEDVHKMQIQQLNSINIWETDFSTVPTWQDAPNVEYFFNPKSPNSNIFIEENQDYHNDFLQDSLENKRNFILENHVTEEILSPLEFPIKLSNVETSTEDFNDSDAEEFPENELLNGLSAAKERIEQMIFNIDSQVLNKGAYTHIQREVFDPSILCLLECIESFNRGTSLPSVEDTTRRPLNDNDVLPDEDPCANLPNYGVILIKSPSSASQLWDEYVKIPSELAVNDVVACILNLKKEIAVNSNDSTMLNLELIMKRKSSIKMLEERLGSSWRNKDKNFSRQINRRKKIWKSIEEGLRDGVPLHDCFDILDRYVQKSHKGLSLYYNGVPFRIKDLQNEFLF
ncbi:uncharacterized protein NDAI_0G03220 [Naumovozyma dairenensis CBS 421]|uniref:Transcription activator GCR1-like domain-containing protein n=1 Tax=Naumovozyma dairenensis (strain ATCC 10597 / BCRC 20456 / CBS 421 / NBRC 0211 / NRRL Y-12639) TaxID=1071378 RepID=G0WE88_NAUDC|nr:hypothetical protein NDAI_0G03220 [Naumovozyma dairenensis CBS 421]CCD26099.2 hypothetical protein NDAI_0G03220 [Naumovozyma dairenensis CBS 421]